MAKTVQSIKNKEDVRRVSNQEAIELTNSGKFKYIGKYEGQRILGGGNTEPMSNQSMGANLKRLAEEHDKQK